jgi:hypothetical protein
MEVETMTIQYMDDGFAPHMDRGFASAKTRLEPSRLSLDQGGETEGHSRALVEHVLALEPEQFPPSRPNFSPRRLPWRMPSDKLKEEDPLRLSGPGTIGKS